MSRHLHNPRDDRPAAGAGRSGNGAGGGPYGGGALGALYAYCLLACSSPPPVDDAPPGLPGLGAARLVPVADGLHLVAADAPLPAYSGAEIDARLGDLSWVSDRALAHERVVEHFLTRAGDTGCTVVPLKLFTLFADEGRAAERLAARRGAVDAAVERLAGRVEWGVRVHFDAQAARRQGGEAAAAAQGAASGRGYLQAKKLSREAVRDAAVLAREAADRLHSELAEVAFAAQRREAGDEAPALVLDAAYLVDAGRQAELEEVLAAGAQRLRGAACETVVSGPWPGYHFAGEVG
jgi:hypothetical protein